MPRFLLENWHELENESQLEAIIEASFEKPQLIFKHSIRCGISAQVLDQLAHASNNLEKVATLYYLDLINFRAVSNQVAKEFDVLHQSPQVLLIQNGKIIYSSSHFAISPEKILSVA